MPRKRNQNAKMACVSAFLYVFCGVPWLHGQEVSFETVGRLRDHAYERRDDRAQQALVYSILTNHEKSQRRLDASCDDESLTTALKDLDVLCGSGQDERASVLDRLLGDSLATRCGEAMAAKRLARVITDTRELSAYRDFVEELVIDSSAARELAELLATVKEAEADVVSFWAEQPAVERNFIESFYFGSLLLKPQIITERAETYFFAQKMASGAVKYVRSLEAMNHSTTMLELRTRLAYGGLVYGLIGDIALTTATIYAVNKIIGQACTLGSALHGALGFYNPKVGIDELRYHRSAAGRAKHLAMAGRFAQADGKNFTEAEMAIRAKKYGSAFSILAGFKVFASSFNVIGRVFATKTFIDTFRRKRDVVCHLQGKLMSVARYVRALKMVCDVARRNPKLACALPVKAVEEAFFGTGTSELKELVKLLMTDTFKGKPSFFSNAGRILVAYKRMHECKNDFVGAFKLFGDLDTCVALSRAHKKYAGSHAQLCCATYSELNGSHVEAQDFWHPLVAHESVVTNSASFGSPDTMRIMVTTGSNKGGKSTVLKAIALCVLCAQTITLVPARSFSVAPCSFFATYMNVCDDTARGRSLFHEQIMRAKKLVATLDSLDATKGERAFVVIDELFNGTRAVDGADAAKKFILHMAHLPTVCCAIATHFVDELSALEGQTGGICKNFKMDGVRGADSIIFSHLLEPGVSENGVARELLLAEMPSIEF